MRVPEAKRKGPRYTPVSRRHDRPNAILWLVRNHPELKDAQIMRLVGTTKSTIAGDPRPHPLELGQSAADGPGDAGPVLPDRPRLRGQARREAVRPAAAAERSDLLPAAETTRPEPAEAAEGERSVDLSRVFERFGKAEEEESER